MRSGNVWVGCAGCRASAATAAVLSLLKGCGRLKLLQKFSEIIPNHFPSVEVKWPRLKKRKKSIQLEIGIERQRAGTKMQFHDAMIEWRLNGDFMAGVSLSLLEY